MALPLNSRSTFQGSLRTLDGGSLACNTVGGTQILESPVPYDGQLVTSDGHVLQVSTSANGAGSLYFTEAGRNALCIDNNGRQVQIVVGTPG
jgi:hypothetical protein